MSHLDDFQSHSSLFLFLSVLLTREVDGVPLDGAVHGRTTTPILNSTANVTGHFTSVVDPYLAADTDFQKSVHLSTSLAGMILLLLLQFHIREHGYKLSRSFIHSTDDLAFIGMSIVSGGWLMLIFLSAYIWEDGGLNPCREEPGGYQCLARLAFVPWVLVGVFLWWAAYYLAHRLTRILRRMSNLMHNDPEPRLIVRKCRPPKPGRWF
jgi:hypothetical protein